MLHGRDDEKAVFVVILSAASKSPVSSRISRLALGKNYWTTLVDLCQTFAKYCFLDSFTMPNILSKEASPPKQLEEAAGQDGACDLIQMSDCTSVCQVRILLIALEKAYVFARSRTSSLRKLES